MKSLTAPNTVQISGTQPWPTGQPDGKLHDPWPTHAYNDNGGFFLVNTAASLGVFGGVFELIDSVFYYYPIFIGDPADALRVFALWSNRPFHGEDWNYYLRPSVIAKYNETDWAAWLASH